MAPADPPAYADNVAEAAALNVIAQFAMAQEEQAAALETYLSGTISAHVMSILWERLRLNDKERMESLIALAKATDYPLHVGAYRKTFADAKAVRDRLAHGGLYMAANALAPAEPGLFTFGDADANGKFYRLSVLQSAAEDARWLYVVAWRVRTLISGESMPLWVREPSDLPKSAVDDAPVSRAGWGAPPVCPNGHGNVVGVGTHGYGGAWLCGHCSHIRVRNDASLIGSRAVLAESDDASGAE